MTHPISLKRWPRTVGLPFLLAASAVTGAAQMGMGSQDGMEGMDAPPTPAPKAKPAPSEAMHMAPAPKPAPAGRGGGLTMATPAKPAPKSDPSMTPSTKPTLQGMGTVAPAPSASSSGMAGMTTTPAAGEAMPEMEEPAPSTLNGGLILAIFAALNAGIIAVAAVLKIKRNHPSASSEVKA